MENDEEILRLEIKTDINVVEKQALWAGIKPGMRVADIGCGSGKTTSILHRLASPNGETIGIDGSETRLKYAEANYKKDGISFCYKNILEPIEEIGNFDFIWVRFILEYFLNDSFKITENLSKILKKGGILCLIDLDHNSLNHYGIPPRLERTTNAITKILLSDANFDPYVGRKIYTYLYDLGFEDIRVDVSAHHLIYGKLNDIDSFNWLKKIEVISKKINFLFDEYEGGYEEFLAEFKNFFTHPRRFTYTPMIAGRGVKP